MRRSCLEHTALCLLEKDAVGPGGLRSKPLGPLSRATASSSANRKLEKVASQQRRLKLMLSLEHALAHPAAPHEAKPSPRATIEPADWRFSSSYAKAAAAAHVAEAAKVAAAEATAAEAAAAASVEPEAAPPPAARPHYLDSARAQSRPARPWHLPDPDAVSGSSSLTAPLLQTPRAHTAEPAAPGVSEMDLGRAPSPPLMPLRPSTSPPMRRSRRPRASPSPDMSASR